jgi:hypothetical protein
VIIKGNVADFINCKCTVNCWLLFLKHAAFFICYLTSFLAHRYFFVQIYCKHAANVLWIVAFVKHNQFSLDLLFKKIIMPSELLTGKH